ncbi:hypothetical protein [Microcoleus sp. PH2017_27_LUM_O_A]|uniref:hypothetical protein n=1 Tax=Microcoleus sp. PH2017_27_LUM_O_A TaxID=2798837 RepID=UPI0025FD2259|nr:hypothetical protein [Microcoleus sp. PH2017_27_LUM_O_A]
MALLENGSYILCDRSIVWTSVRRLLRTQVQTIEPFGPRVREPPAAPWLDAVQ